MRAKLSLTKTIVLWDIDNTLLYTGGAGGVGMARAFHDLYGVADAFGRVEFSGRSDMAIFRDAARTHAVPSCEEQAELERFLAAYLPHLDTALGESSGHLMPGVAATLEALAARDDVVQGLGTGNFRPCGEMKLRYYGIDGYFPGCVGGFGEDSEQRAEIIGRGIERMINGASERPRIVVIGDTPHDVSAAKANGAFALAVATGRDSVGDLEACGANVALEDLSDVERAVAIITGTPLSE